VLYACAGHFWNPKILGGLCQQLQRAIADKINIVDALDHILSAESKAKKGRAIESQIQMSGFPFRKTLDMFDFSFQPSIDRTQIDELTTMRFVENRENVVFLGAPGVGKTHLAVSIGMIAAQHRYSTYYINCNALIEQLNRAHFENRLPDRLRHFAKYKVLIIDEIGYLPMDIQGANFFFQLIAKRYERNSTILTSNKMFSQWNEVFSDLTIASAILDRILHHCTVVSIKGDSYRLKERVAAIKKRRDKVMLHCCGNTRSIMDMLIETGIDGYQSLQANANMELDDLIKNYGDKLCFFGGISVDVLLTGTPEEVRGEVRRSIEAGRKYGGFILGPSHSVAYGAKYDNFMAMLDEHDKLKYTV